MHINLTCTEGDDCASHFFLLLSLANLIFYQFEKGLLFVNIICIRCHLGCNLEVVITFHIELKNHVANIQLAFPSMFLIITIMCLYACYF
jgi:hypothetical protein